MSRRQADAHFMRFPEIGHEKAQSVIDSITSSYAAEGQANANPMLQAATMGAPGSLGPPPPPFGFPGASLLVQRLLLQECLQTTKVPCLRHFHLLCHQVQGIVGSSSFK